MKKTLSVAVVAGIGGGIVGFALAFLVLDRTHTTAPLHEPAALAASEATPSPPATLPAEVPPERRELSASGEGPPGPGGLVLLHGTVGALGDRPLSAGHVLLRGEWGEELRTEVAASSTYSLSGVPPGQWTLETAGFVGFYAVHHALTLRADQPVLRQDLLLTPCLQIPVKLEVPSNAELASLLPSLTWFAPRWSVIATRDPPRSGLDGIANEPAGVFTRASDGGVDGRPLVPEGYSGVLQLTAPPPAVASVLLFSAVLASQPVTENTSELVFHLTGNHVLGGIGTVRGRILDAETRQPLESASVIATSDPSQKWFLDHVQLEDGTFQQCVAAGEFRLWVRASGHENIVRSGRAAAGQTTDLGDLFLHEGAAIFGKLLDENGEPVRVPLEWAALAGDSSLTDEVRYTELKADWISTGEFVLAELPREGILLRACDPQWAVNPVAVATDRSLAEDVVVRLRRGTPVTVRCRDASGALLYWSILDSAGAPVVYRRASGSFSTTLRLLPGSYRLSASQDSRLQVEIPFAVAGKPVDVSLDL